MTKQDQAKLYYLYMLADGELSPREKKNFNNICKELNLTADVKVIAKFKELAKQNKLSSINILKENAEDKVSQDIFKIKINDLSSKKVHVSILWNLVNLGYADSYYSIEEKEFVEYLKTYWDIEDVIYQEMIDVAETVTSLENEKAWADQLPAKEKKLKEKQINDDINFAFNSIKTTISELD